MKHTKTKVVPEIQIRDGIPVQVFPAIMPSITERQSSFGGHFRSRSAQMEIIDRTGGVKCLGFHHKKDH